MTRLPFRSSRAQVQASLSLLCALAVTAVPAPLRAALPEATLREAGRHFDQGVKLSEEGDWRAALIEFERAYAIAPHYRVLYNIGQCRFQLQDYAGALEAFERYLQQGGSDLAADRRKQVEATCDELRNRVGRLLISTSSPGAEIAIDDIVVGTSPLGGPVKVSAGRRKVAASWPGQPAIVRFVDVAGRDSIEVSLVLPVPAPPLPRSRLMDTPGSRLMDTPGSRPMDTPGSRPMDTPGSRPMEPFTGSRQTEPLTGSRAIDASTGSRPDDMPLDAHVGGGRSMAPAYVAFGLAAAGLGVGTGFAIAALGEKRDLDQQCGSAKVCPSSSQTLLDTANRNATIATIGLAGGGALAATSLVWTIYAQSESRSRAPSGSTFSPSVSIGISPPRVEAHGTF